MARRRKAPPPQVEMEILPPGLEQKDWEDFVANRELLGSPMTPIARKRMLSKIGRLLAEGHDVAGMIERSLINGWQDLYPEERAPAAASGARPQVSEDRITRQMIEAAALPGETEEDVVRRLRQQQQRQASLAHTRH